MNPKLTANFCQEQGPVEKPVLKINRMSNPTDSLCGYRESRKFAALLSSVHVFLKYIKVHLNYKRKLNLYSPLVIGL